MPLYLSPAAVPPGTRWEKLPEWPEPEILTCPGTGQGGFSCGRVLLRAAPSVLMCRDGLHAWHVGSWRGKDGIEVHKGVIRYVPTYINHRDGLRTLVRACQGRETFATQAEAQEWIDAMRGPEGLCKVFTPKEMESLEVRGCECWPGHFDPKGVYFRV